MSVAPAVIFVGQVVIAMLGAAFFAVGMLTASIPHQAHDQNI